MTSPSQNVRAKERLLRSHLFRRSSATEAADRVLCVPLVLGGSIPADRSGLRLRDKSGHQRHLEEHRDRVRSLRPVGRDSPFDGQHRHVRSLGSYRISLRLTSSSIRMTHNLGPGVANTAANVAPLIANIPVRHLAALAVFSG